MDTAPRFATNPHPLGRIARGEQLREALEKIQATTPNARADPEHDPDFQTLWGAHQQLVAVIEFIEGDPRCAGRVAALHRLQEALLDIFDGRRVRWLMPAPRPGAPRIGGTIGILRGRMAAVVEFLMRGGLTETEAAKFVARYGAIQRLISRGKQPLWRIVQDWRQQVKVQGHVVPSAQREGFTAMLALIEQLGFGRQRANAPAEAKRLLAAVNKVDVS
jgi:hypothetical protein